MIYDNLSGLGWTFIYAMGVFRGLVWFGLWAVYEITLGS
jgi:hypothetical protein